MDKLLRFCIQRDPQILVYKAVYDIVEDLKCPVDNREHLLGQLVEPDSEADERAEIATLAAELLPAYVFPMSSKQNALEKIVEAVESYLGPKLRRGGSRMMPDPHDPDQLGSWEVFQTGWFTQMISFGSGILRKFHLPNSVVTVNAALLTRLADLTKKPPLWNISRDQVRTIGTGLVFDGSTAERELGVTYTPVRVALEEAIASYEEGG